jgi:hypothetical protein
MDMKTTGVTSSSKDASKQKLITDAQRIANPVGHSSTHATTVLEFLIRNLNRSKKWQTQNVEDGIEIDVIRQFRAFPEGVHPMLKGIVGDAIQAIRLDA